MLYLCHVLNQKELMEDIHEYNYQQKGYNKYVIDYTFHGEARERTMKAYDKTETGAKRQLKEYWRKSGVKIDFTHVYVC